MQTVSAAKPADSVASHRRESPWVRLRNWINGQEERRRIRLAGVSKEGVTAWRNAASISPEDRSRLEGQFQRACMAEYQRRLVTDRIGNLLIFAAMILWIPYIFLLPLLLPPGYQVGGYIDTLMLVSWTPFLFLVCLYIIITWIVEYLSDRWLFSKFKKEAGAVGIFLL